MTITISDELLRSLLPNRREGTHKWEVGGTLVIAGSPGYPGAAWLASRSAGRNGAGVVYLATPRSVIGTMASAMPEVAFVPLPETESMSSARRAVDRLEDVLGKVRSVVIGPGLGNDESTACLLGALFGLGEDAGMARGAFGFRNVEWEPDSQPRSIFDLTDAQIVMDADALNWLAKQSAWWEHVPAHRLVLTPHPGEAHRLTGIDPTEITADPAEFSAHWAREWQQTVVLKSGFTAASNGEQTVQSDLAPTALATAGSGDCFAGAIGAYLAQGCAPVDAATLAIGIGSRAAARLESTWGAAGVLASDLPDMMAQCTQQLS